MKGEEKAECAEVIYLIALKIKDWFIITTNESNKISNDEKKLKK
jgi:hypothetical protein